jgi:hypothetical protein
MIDDLLRIPFEWFLTVVWERHGPVVGVLTALGLLGAIVGLAVLAINSGTWLVGAG